VGRPPTPPFRHRIDYIDGLRAIAVLVVLVAHVAAHGNTDGAPYRVMMEGAHGVDLFFVLSGFCLAFPTLVKLREGTAKAFDVAEFGAKRIVRITPPFYIATAVLLAFLALPHLIVHHALPPDLPNAWSLLGSLFFLDGNVQLLNSSFWTLMVEFRWYFAFPLLLWLWIRSPRAFLVAGIASMLLYQLTRARGLDFGTLPGFMLGIVAADLAIAGERTAGWGPHVRRWAPWLIVPFAALGIACEPWARIPGFSGNDVQFAYQPTILGWQLAVFALVVAVGASPLAHRILSMRALVATGIASYSIYLVHEPVIRVVDGHLHGLAGNVAAGCIALAGGFAFWALAELPFTTGPLRAPLVAFIQPYVVRAFAAAGIGRRIDLTGAALHELHHTDVGVVRPDYASSRLAVVAPSSPT
jgi:peptidoglycan/LPS O-acetylase OafA/YrhL